MPQASKWLCGISVYFYMFLSASVSFYMLLLFLYVSLFTDESLFLLL